MLRNRSTGRCIHSCVCICVCVFLYVVDMKHKGPFINYVRVPREGELEKSLHTLTLEGQTHSYVIFSKSIFYIRNHAVKWFGKDHISFI